MKYLYDIFSTPFGDFSIMLDEKGAVVATAFGGLAALKKRTKVVEASRDPFGTRKARGQVLDFLSGKIHAFDLELAPVGTVFQQSVWSALLRIPYGKTRTYGAVAADLGNPNASRAVGRASGANPICLIVPCHRVVGSDGSLTGFAFGAEIKQRLLKIEGARRPTVSPA